jgi:hypothetical protein
LVWFPKVLDRWGGKKGEKNEKENPASHVTTSVLKEDELGSSRKALS